jgi:hypothetical protein
MHKSATKCNETVGKCCKNKHGASKIIDTLETYQHAERKKPEDYADDDEADKILRHPSDASQWKALDIEYPEFEDDPRNVRLGVSTDGLNPFGSQSSTHSTWPVFVWMYNLPPLDVHEEEVHTNDYVNSRSETTE